MNNIAAALVFFTRLPFWRLKCFNVSAQYYKEVINYWAVVGWLTGGVMVGTLWLGSLILPHSIAVILALLSRLLITGALHEDGLADFLDGFGGGNNKERILEIMKDSHIGTYGVLSLIIYFLLFFSLLNNMPINIACVSILIADPLCKFISSLITLFLSYARTAETSKLKAVYNKISFIPFAISAIFALLPFLLIPNVYFLIAIIFPIFIFFLLIFLMKKKIQGYTGDCCGAMFLLCEISFYLGITVCLKFV